MPTLNPEEYKLKQGESPEQYNIRIAQLRGDKPEELASMQAATKASSSKTRLPGESLESFVQRLDGKVPEAPKADVGTSYASPAPVITSNSRKEQMAEIKSGLETGLPSKPGLFKSVEEFAKLRQEKGIVQDEEELLSLREESLKEKQNLREFESRASQGVPEAGRAGLVSEEERNLNFRLEGLAIREQAILNRLNTKNSYINAVIQLGQEDYQVAYTDYTNEFNKNLKVVDLYNKTLNDQQKDAMTALTTINNLFKNKKLDISADPNLKAQINTMELQAGLPLGVFESAISQLGDEKILAPLQIDTEVGKDVYFFTQDPQGNPHLKKVVSLPGAPDTSVVDERQKRQDLADMLAQISNYKSRDEALNAVNRLESSIRTRVGEDGFQKVKDEVDRIFPPPPEEKKAEKIGEAGGVFGAVSSFFERLFTF